MDRERSTLREPVFIGKKVKDDENLSHNLEDIHDRSDNERKGSSSLEFQTTERNLSAMKRNVIFTVLNNPSNQNNDNKNYSDLYFDSEKEETRKSQKEVRGERLEIKNARFHFWIIHLRFFQVLSTHFEKTGNQHFLRGFELY